MDIRCNEAELFSYEKYADSVHFCIDEFREEYSVSSNCTVMFHCRDGNLYEAECPQPIYTAIHSGDRKYVRLLRRVKSHPILDVFFGDGGWPLKKWKGMPLLQAPKTLQDPVQVLSESGRREIDKLHREFVCLFPQVPLTIVHAPPGAGKTTALLAAVCAWSGKRVLVVTFNKSVQQTMSRRLEEASLQSRTDVRTLNQSVCSRLSFPRIAV